MGTGVTPDEARGLIDESDGYPVVKWRDKHQRWRFAYLTGVGRKWATLRVGNGQEFPTQTCVSRLRSWSLVESE